MKKKLIIIFLIIIFLSIGYFAYAVTIGPVWSICENGFYSKYPSKNILDANAEFYDSNDTMVGSCGFWNSANKNCQDIREKAGKCRETNSLKFFFVKKLGF